jgi:hypothetical protein
MEKEGDGKEEGREGTGNIPAGGAGRSPAAGGVPGGGGATDRTLEAAAGWACSRVAPGGASG